MCKTDKLIIKKRPPGRRTKTAPRHLFFMMTAAGGAARLLSGWTRRTMKIFKQVNRHLSDASGNWKAKERIIPSHNTQSNHLLEASEKDPS